MINLMERDVHPTSQAGEWINESFSPGLVSVIVPVYNRQNQVCDTLESVYQQNYRPIELVIIDDGSTDESCYKIGKWIQSKEFSENFSVLFLGQKNSGAPTARNRGVIVSNGEFIQFLDSDDILFPVKIERSVQLIKETGADYVYCRVELVDAQLNRLRTYFGTRGVGRDRDITDYLWQTMCPLFKRSTVKNAGPWLEFATQNQDWEYGARMELLGAERYYDEFVGGLFRTGQTACIGTETWSEKKVKKLSIRL
ncbi:glycosyltransferase family A protein [uncultured Vibrio sp.]|uniref:glycosyltransferase family 2 protein n=1 Tax=uncultured Vibrio sp. TaxID=114054 RepID=UPI002AA804FE|nr:glycosyltransferase family A protein [uncultured Vibrio sp.]